MNLFVVNYQAPTQAYITSLLEKMNREVTLNQSSDNKQRGNTASYLLCTLFTQLVAGRQMSWQRVELDWCIPAVWQFWIMALATHTTSSSGMSDKMILIPHINEINESVQLKVEKPAFPFCLALK